MSNNIASNLEPYVVATADAGNLPNSVVLPPSFISGTTAPADTNRGWIDTTDGAFVAKLYNIGSGSWDSIMGSDGAPGAAAVFSPVAASFTAGAPAATGLLCDVVDREWFIVGGYVLINDSTGAFAVYQTTGWSTDPTHTNGIILTRVDPGTDASAASSGYSFTPANNAIAQMTGLPMSMSDVVGGLNYLGPWNASTNTPALASGVGTANDWYIVSVAGTTTLDGISSWVLGEWLVFVGGVWRSQGAIGIALSDTTPTALTVGGSGAAGSDTQASKGDHTHALPGAFSGESSGNAPGFVPAPGLPAATGNTRVLGSDGSFDDLFASIFSIRGIDGGSA